LFQLERGAGGYQGRGLVLADIPGLLEGAHEGVGMGVAFLRHVSRCRALIHVVDGASIDPLGDFNAINNELRLFNPMLAKKPQVGVCVCVRYEIRSYRISF
jgi:GTPase